MQLLNLLLLSGASFFSVRTVRYGSTSAGFTHFTPSPDPEPPEIHLAWRGIVWQTEDKKLHTTSRPRNTGDSIWGRIFVLPINQSDYVFCSSNYLIDSWLIILCPNTENPPFPENSCSHSLIQIWCGQLWTLRVNSWRLVIDSQTLARSEDTEESCRGFMSGASDDEPEGED